MKMKRIVCFGLSVIVSCGAINLVQAKNINKNQKSQIISTKKTSGVEVKSKQIKSKDEKIEIDLTIPVITYAKDIKLQNKTNQKFQKDILNYKNEAIKMANEDYIEAKKDGRDFNKHSAAASYKIAYNKNGLLSITVYYDQYAGGPYPTVNIVPTNINLKTGKEFALNDMFKSGVDYKGVINKEIKQQIASNKDLKDGINFNGISDKQAFFIENGKIVIYLEDTPHVLGVQMFNIPKSKLRGILKPEFLNI